MSEVEALRLEVAQMRFALVSRITIENAKGFVVGRLSVSTQEAFEMIRTYCRSTNMKIDDVCRGILDESVTVMALLAKNPPGRVWAGGTKRTVYPKIGDSHPATTVDHS